MAIKDLSQSPYNTPFDPADKYRTVLFRPGLAVQNRELNEMQVAAQHYQNQAWGTVYKNGSVVSGCNTNINDDTNTFSIGAGKFYFNGAVHDIDADSVTFTGTGTEKIGFKLNETIVGPQAIGGVDSVDTALLDNASGYDNYGNPGAHRLKVDFKLSVIPTTIPADEIYFEVWEITDGELTKTPVGPDYTTLGDTLARRTYDESGHYIVRGMTLTTEQSPEAGKIQVAVAAGKAYVLGYEINFIAAQRTLVDAAVDTADMYQTLNETINRNNQLTSATTMYVQLSSIYGLSKGNYIQFDDGQKALVYHLEPSATVSISAVADYSGIVAGTVKVTTQSAHGQTSGTFYVTITNTTNYNGTHLATYISDTEFYITSSYVADENTGTCKVLDDGFAFIAEYDGTKSTWDAMSSVAGFYDNKDDVSLDTSLVPTIISRNLFAPYELAEPYVYQTKTAFTIDLDIVECSSGQTDGTSYTLPNGTNEILYVFDTSGTAYTSFTLSGGIISGMSTGGKDWFVIYTRTKTLISSEFNVADSSNTDYSTIDFYDGLSQIYSPADPIAVDYGGNSISPEVEFTYNSYKARTDVITIDSSGDIRVIEGQLTHYTETIVPSIPNNVLPLGWIKFMPGGDYDSAIINHYNLRRTTMAEIIKIAERVVRNEENVATLALEQEIKEGNLASNLKGIYVDAMQDFYKSDTGNTNYNVAINPIDREMTMAVNSTEKSGLSVSLSNIREWTMPNAAGGTTPKLYTLDTVDDQVIYMTNTARSGSINLNPYGAITIPTVAINPTSENFIETETSESTITTSVEPSSNNRVVNKVAFRNLRVAPASPRRFGLGKVTRTNIQQGDTRSVYVGERTANTIPARTISYNGKGFTAGNEVTIDFDGEFMKSVIVDANGKISGSFSIQGGRYSTGEKQVKFTEVNGTTVVKEAVAVYNATGIVKIFEEQTEVIHHEMRPPTRTITPPATRCKTMEWVEKADYTGSDPSHYALFWSIRWKAGNSQSKTAGSYASASDISTYPVTDFSWWAHECTAQTSITNDPIAQSFIFDEDVILTGIKVWFTGLPAAPATAPDAFMNIGFTANGYPDTQTIFRTQFITASDISANADVNGGYDVMFDLPVYVPAYKEFFISFGSSSTEYQVAISELGKTDQNGDTIAKNGYLDGVLFASSNNNTWSAQQIKDLSFVLYTATFKTNGSVVIAKQTGLDIGGFMTTADYELPKNCQLKSTYDATTIASGEAVPFKLNSEVWTGKSTVALELTHNLSGDGNLSPIVDAEQISRYITRDYDTSTDCWYMTKQVDNTPDYDTVKMVLDIYEDPSNGVELGEIQFWNGTDWTSISFTSPSSTTSTDIGNGWYQKTYVFDMANTLTSFKCRMRLDGLTWKSPIIKNIRFLMTM